MSAISNSNNNSDAAEARYSRQTAAYGESCGRRIFNSVCVVAWRTQLCSTAVVAETLKNLALSGVREIDLIDDGDEIDPVLDVSSNSLVHPYLLASSLTENSVSSDDSSGGAVRRAGGSLCIAFKQGLLDLNSSLIVNILPVHKDKTVCANWFERVESEVTHRFSELRQHQQLIGCFLLCHPFDRRDCPEMSTMFKNLEATNIPYTHVQSAGVFGRITNNFDQGFIVADPAASQPTQATVSKIGVADDDDQSNNNDASSSSSSCGASSSSKCFIELVAEDTEADAMSGSAVDEGNEFKLIYTGGSSEEDSSSSSCPPLVQQLNSLVQQCGGSFIVERVEKTVCSMTKQKKHRYFFNLISAQERALDTTTKNTFITFCRSACNLPLRYSQIPSKQTIDRFDVADRQADDINDTSVMFRTLTRFSIQQQQQQLPRIHNTEDVSTMSSLLIDLSKEIVSSSSEDAATPNLLTLLSGNLTSLKIRQFSRTARLQPNFFATYVGSFAAQEVLKFFTQKWIPMQNPVCLDMAGCLPRRNSNRNSTNSNNDFFPDDVLSQNEETASDIHYSAIYGAANLERMRSSRMFLVGAGALGCEYIKVFALMGLCSTGKGALTITDDDSIAVSNLSRQLLFRPQHVGQNKSLIAADVAKKMSALAMKHRGSSMFTRALQLRLDAKSSHPVTGIFNHRFWTQQNVLISGVDNVKARSFLSEMSQQHLLPLVDAGTNGPLGHVAAVLPFVTSPLEPNKGGANQDKNIPVCTLHFFPTTVAHCSHHALNTFKNLFGDSTTTEDAMSCDEEDSTKRKTPELSDALQKACSAWFPIFVKPVLDLRKAKPPNAKEADGVTPYYSSSSSRRCPEVPSFDPVNDQAHRAFIIAFAKLWLRYHKIEFNEHTAEVTLGNLLTEIALKDNWIGVMEQYVKDYVPQATVIPGAEGENNISDEKTDENNDEVTREDSAPSAATANEDETDKAREATFSALAMDFEKDDEDHLSFVWAATVVRARCYSIFAPNKSDVQRIAGRMVPALITTTASVVAGGVYNTLAMLLHHVSPQELLLMNNKAAGSRPRGPPTRRSAASSSSSTNNNLLEPIIFSSSTPDLLKDSKLNLCNTASILLDYMVNMAHGQMAALAFEQLLVDTSTMDENSIDINDIDQWRRLSWKIPEFASATEQYSVANLVFDLLKMSYQQKKSSKKKADRQTVLLNSFFDRNNEDNYDDNNKIIISTPSDVESKLSVVLKLRLGVEQPIVFQHTVIPGSKGNEGMMSMLPANMLIHDFVVNSAKKQITDADEKESSSAASVRPPPFVESELFVHYLGGGADNGGNNEKGEDDNNKNALTIFARLNL